MKKHELKDYNRLLRAENEALREILHMAADSLSDGCRCGEIKLLQEENTELLKEINDLHAIWAQDESKLRYFCLELAKDLNDFAADWAIDHAAIINQHKADCALSDMTLQEFERDIGVLTEERDRFRGVIKEFKKEKYDMGMELEKLKMSASSQNYLSAISHNKSGRHLEYPDSIRVALRDRKSVV